MQLNGHRMTSIVNTFSFEYHEPDRIPHRKEINVNKMEPALRSEIIQSQLSNLFDNSEDVLKMSSLLDLTSKRFAEKLSSGILPLFLRRTRWFAGKGQRISTVYIEDYVESAMVRGEALILLVEVRYIKGNKEYYQLPVCFLTEQELGGCWPGPRHAVITPAQVNNIDGFISDATCSADFRAELLKCFQQPAFSDAQLSPIRFIPRYVDIFERARGEESRVLHAEQSNTSIVYDDRIFLKLYRKVAVGINSDIEICRFLSERTTFRQTPGWLGEIQWKRSGGTIALGILQNFVTIQSDGWSQCMKLLTKANREVLVKAGKFGKDSKEVKSVLESLARPLQEQAKKMAVCTADMHKALGSVRDIPEFAREPITNDYYDHLCAGLQVNLESAFESLKGRLEKMAGHERDESWLLMQQFDHICDWITEHTGEVDNVMRIRVHGDLHLGQFLFDGAGYLVTDFEGEPGLPFQARRAKHSPLKDVAGMLRSFHYAAYASVLLDNMYDDSRVQDVMPILQKWFEEMKDNFLHQYVEAMDASGLLPADRHKFETLLNIYLLEKALYELEYELNNRPSWAIIPLVGIRAILNELLSKDHVDFHH
jgi:maltose alpha-D-glucosyltransferase/alpha-amylase